MQTAIDASVFHRGFLTDAQGLPRALDGDLNGSMLGDIGAFEHGHVVVDRSGRATPAAC